MAKRIRLEDEIRAAEEAVAQRQAEWDQAVADCGSLRATASAPEFRSTLDANARAARDRLGDAHRRLSVLEARQKTLFKKFEEIATPMAAVVGLVLAIISIVESHNLNKVQSALPDVHVAAKQLAPDRVSISVSNTGAASEPAVKVQGASIGARALLMSSTRPKLLPELPGPVPYYSNLRILPTRFELVFEDLSPGETRSVDIWIDWPKEGERYAQEVCSSEPEKLQPDCPRVARESVVAFLLANWGKTEIGHLLLDFFSFSSSRRTERVDLERARVPPLSVEQARELVGMR